MNHVDAEDDASSRLRVLVVDDDQATVDTMAAILGNEVEVTTCTSPMAALRSISGAEFDVICSDYTMPGMTGVELLGRVSTQAPHAGCLLITGAIEHIDRSAGDYYVLLKPYDPDRLVRLVRQLGRVAQMKRSVGALMNGRKKEPS